MSINDTVKRVFKQATQEGADPYAAMCASIITTGIAVAEAAEEIAPVGVPRDQILPSLLWLAGISIGAKYPELADKVNTSANLPMIAMIACAEELVALMKEAEGEDVERVAIQDAALVKLGYSADALFGRN